MFDTLPNLHTFMGWSWAQIEPYYRDLLARDLNDSNAVEWLSDLARLSQLLEETHSRLEVETTLDTEDQARVDRFLAYNETVITPARALDNELRKKILASGINPPGYAVQLRNMREEADLFREANLPLLLEEDRLTSEHDRISGAQTVVWEGEEKTVPAMKIVQQNPNRAVREQAWRLVNDRILADKDALNAVWIDLLKLRHQMAINAGLPDYRAYMWRKMRRFDYTPQDCEAFHAAIERTFVPAAARIDEKRRQRLGVDTLRPWDQDVDTRQLPPLKPFAPDDTARLVTRSAAIFHKVDPALGAHFETMVRDELLDLDNRKGKAPGGYCTDYAYSQRPFIFMNAIGIHDDVQTMLHEGGHAFHSFETFRLPAYQRGTVPDYDVSAIPIEMAEVASMSMELLAAPYLAASEGGFYSDAEAARARIEHLEGIIAFMPYMAVVDAFQHWAYTHVDQALDPANCDAQWAELFRRFIPSLDFTGLESALADGWHRKLHIYQYPFYYVEYGLAQVGALQVWNNALTDQAGAVAAYRRALALGGTRPLPELFQAAGARFTWDADTLQMEVDLIERTLAQLESQL
ncbi:MAG: M3 family oligoendopeptidase [bacterium]|nr:M3 family oligoendopeptidase [bacterium]